MGYVNLNALKTNISIKDLADVCKDTQKDLANFAKNIIAPTAKLGTKFEVIVYPPVRLTKY